jgi:hypothetical protein
MSTTILTDPDTLLDEAPDFLPPHPDDAAWWAEESDRVAFDRLDAELDALAREAEALDAACWQSGAWSDPDQIAAHGHA